jgi:hypothetical protein
VERLPRHSDHASRSRERRVALARLGLPDWLGEPDDAARTLRLVDAYAASDALSALVSASGGRVDDRRGDELFDYLERFSAEHWDFRAGRERNLADDGRIDRQLAELVLELAPQLGLADNHHPSRTHYDTIVMTGGMVRAGIVKPRFVADLLTRGLTANSVVFLGAFRPFGGDEIELARALDIAGDDEFDAMTVGLQRAFGLDDRPEQTGERSPVPTRSWAVRRWSMPDVDYSVVAAPGSGDRRATTADTYRFWFDSIRTASERSVLVVTTPIYVPYQAAGAVEVLGLGGGLAVETRGITPQAGDLGVLTQEFLPQHHLQELRSAIRGLHSLRRALLAASAPSSVLSVDTNRNAD